MIWVVGELQGGSATASTREALYAGRILSDGLKTELNLIVAGGGAQIHEETLTRKANKIYVLEHKLLNAYTSRSVASPIAGFLWGRDVSVVIAPGSSFGRDVSPALAVMLDAACVTNVSAMEVKDNAILARRPLYGGRIIETLSIRGRAVISVMQKAFKEAQDSDPAGELIRAQACINEKERPVSVKETLKDDGVKDITEADVIVSGGRGVGNAENFKLLKELADSLGGQVAASRAAVDSGWALPAIQVGQTGRTVAPKLYIACAISGAPQHLAGMRGSRYVMAINKDPNAPIFKEADLCITGDIFEVIPALIKGIKAAQRR